MGDFSVVVWYFRIRKAANGGFLYYLNVLKYSLN